MARLPLFRTPRRKPPRPRGRSLFRWPWTARRGHAPTRAELYLESLEERSLLSTPPLSRVALENQLPGNPAQCSGTTVTPEHCWDTDHLDDEEIRGFATQMSVPPGGKEYFKITRLTDPPLPYRVDIYRMGYYQGLGARYQGSAALIQPTLVHQPDCDFDGVNMALGQHNTGLVDCHNWDVSAQWTVPQDAVSGIYFAKFVRL